MPGPDNGYIRTRDGKCGVWDKGSAQVQHTPNTSNGSAAGQTGQLTINSFISLPVSVNDPAIVNYEITSGPADAFVTTVETYRDLGVIGRLDAADVLVDSRPIPSASSGIQQVALTNRNDQVILLAKSPAGCYDKVITIANGAATLPVKLTSFSAFLNNNSTIDLNWTTASEINVSHFIVEKSTDGVNFKEAGLVFAYGNATDKANYSLSDNIASNQTKVIYYRLRSVDIDGKSQISETRIIRIGSKTDNAVTILTYPNPVSNELRITIPANWQNKKAVNE